MILANIREKLRLYWELCEKQKTAAEKVILNDCAQLHDGLVALESKIVIVEKGEINRLRALLVAADPKVELAQLDAAIAIADKAQADIDKAQAAHQQRNTPPAVKPADSVEGKHEVPPSVDATVPAAEAPKN